MNPLRRLGFALWLALALLVGQQAAALHDLGHAIQQVEHKGSTPASNTCDECFACAQLGAAVGIDPPALPQGEATDAVPAERGVEVPVHRPACRLPFHRPSRAPLIRR